MRISTLAIGLAIALVTTGASGPGHTTAATSLYDLSATTLDGKPLPLSTHEGQVVLVVLAAGLGTRMRSGRAVNTASECGFTPQYAGLQKLQTEFADRGFTVLGIPSNDFGGQEPGSAEEIAEVTSSKYQVTFPLLEKASTTGTEQSPVYAFLTEGRGSPKWNFHKYLVGRDGAVVGEFPSSVAPESPELRQAIEAALQ